MEVEIIRKNDDSLRNINSADVGSQKLRVAAYARVSTDLEDQQTSFKSQQQYYLNKIMSNPKWTFVEVYADEGISGTRAEKRGNFMRLIKDATDGKIDLILTKSISRFARNTLDTLKYVRLLKELQVAVIFEEENINTLDMAGELLLTVLSSVAQQESETISSHIKLGLKMKKERGEIVGFVSCYGYKYDYKTKKMTIIPEEAEIVRYIFKKYLNGYGSKTIAQQLEREGVLSPNGLKKWSDSTILGIIKNEKYIGDVEQGKTYVPNVITHKKAKNNGEEDKYYIKDHHEPIISREDFERAQNIRKGRNNFIETSKYNSSRSVFSGRLWCGFCGDKVGRRKTYKDAKWECLAAFKQARLYCPSSKSIREDILEKCFMESYHMLTANDGIAIENFINNIRESSQTAVNYTMKDKLMNEKKNLKEKLSKLVDLYVEEKIEQSVFERKQMDIQNRIIECDEKLEKLNTIIEDEEGYGTKINTIKDKILSVGNRNMYKSFDADLFASLIDYAIIGGYDENGIKNPYMVRFICKKGNSARENITPEFIVNNNNLHDYDTSNFNVVLDFIINEEFPSFETINGRRIRTVVNEVRTRVEIER